MMRIELVKRQGHSPLFSALSPLIALGLTILAGAIMFMLLGKNPVAGLYSYFIEPLTAWWSVEELLTKAAPIILIAIGLACCYRSNTRNSGAAGQVVAGHSGAVSRFPDVSRPAAGHGDGHAGRCGLWRDPGLSEGALQHQ